nr:reverse transcriptase domain-containing protein [Tanacetum cinerariifolium]
MEEEDSRALKRMSESQEDKASKKQKLDEEVEELRKHLMIVPNKDDDVYTEATPLALKVPIVDYEIYTENNKPYYKIKTANGSHQLYLSFLSMLRNFDREDLEVLWQLVKERFKNQRSVHGLAKVKSWKLLESCGVQIITFTTTQLILLVERKYLLTRFTLDQMLNNVRLKVKEESEVSLELLRFIRQQQQEDFDDDPRVPLILRRSFLKTERSLNDVFEGELTLRVSKEAITFNLDQTSRYSTNYNDITAKRIDVIDMAYEEYSQEVLGFSDVNASGNPTPYYDLIVSITSLTLTPLGNSDFLLEEVDAFLALEDDPTSPEVD